MRHTLSVPHPIARVVCKDEQQMFCSWAAAPALSQFRGSTQAVPTCTLCSLARRSQRRERWSLILELRALLLPSAYSTLAGQLGALRALGLPVALTKECLPWVCPFHVSIPNPDLARDSSDVHCAEADCPVPL